MHRVFWAFLAVAFLVGFPVSVGSATELNGALKSGKTHDDLKPVVTTADLKAEKIPPLPERNPLRVQKPSPKEKAPTTPSKAGGVKRA